MRSNHACLTFCLICSLPSQTSWAAPPAQIVKGGANCITNEIPSSSTVMGTLDSDDCAFSGGTVADYWSFEGSAGDEVVLDLSSNDFDTVLLLSDPTPMIVAFDDDGGSGTNSFLRYILNATGQWTITVNHFGPTVGDPGDYTLTFTHSLAIFADDFESGLFSAWSFATGHIFSDGFESGDVTAWSGSSP